MNSSVLSWKPSVFPTHIIAFSLTELLVSLSIIGGLAFVAFSYFRVYLPHTYDIRARTELQNILAAEEAYYSDYEEYVSCETTTCPKLLPGIGAISDGVVVTIRANEDDFTATARHKRGSGKTFVWKNSQGTLAALTGVDE